jgi:hypothetical protein
VSPHELFHALQGLVDESVQVGGLEPDERQALGAS